MREIKFRGCALADKRTVEGYYIKRTFGSSVVHEILRERGTIPVFPESVGQFVNLYDRAGDEIYSNSILAPYGNITKKPNMNECFSVEYKKGSYNIGNESDTDYYVVGDTFNNPELLS